MGLETIAKLQTRYRTATIRHMQTTMRAVILLRHVAWRREC